MPTDYGESECWLHNFDDKHFYIVATQVLYCVRIDYPTSKETLTNAGFQENEALEEDDTEDDRDVDMKD
jgi:hypothetical protein